MNKLNIVEFKNKRVLTSNQLAESYGTTTDVIGKNFNRNKERYILGKHYYLLEGEELKKFKLTTGQIDVSQNKINKLYIWTEKGALLHAKSLNTDKAWEVYEYLVDTYFKVKAYDPYKNLSPEIRAVIELDAKQQQLENKVHKVENRIYDLAFGMPLYAIECDELQGAVKRKGVTILGGYKTPAYNNKSLRAKVYIDIHNQIKREFGLRSYKGIMRKDLDVAKELINEYKAPRILNDEITCLNNQLSFNEVTNA